MARSYYSVYIVWTTGGAFKIDLYSNHVVQDQKSTRDAYTAQWYIHLYCTSYSIYNIQGRIQDFKEGVLIQ